MGVYVVNPIDFKMHWELDMFEMMLGRKADAGGAGMFVREVPASEFITGDALAAAIGLTTGVSQNSTAGWLLFADTVDGKTKYVAKRPLRHSISWDQLHARGAVFGTRTVVIQGLTYKVRLLKGITANTLVGTASGFDLPTTHNSEWNRLLYHISAKPFSDYRNTLASEGIAEGDWASYSEADIGTALGVLSGAAGYGRYQWCQETGTAAANRVLRGNLGVSNLSQAGASDAGVYCGWRAVLELV